MHEIETSGKYKKTIFHHMDMEAEREEKIKQIHVAKRSSYSSFQSIPELQGP